MNIHGCSEAAFCLDHIIRQTEDSTQLDIFITHLVELQGLSSLELNTAEENLYELVESPHSPMGKAVMIVAGALINSMGNQVHSVLWEVCTELSMQVITSYSYHFFVFQIITSLQPA